MTAGCAGAVALLVPSPWWHREVEGGLELLREEQVRACTESRPAENLSVTQGRSLEPAARSCPGHL